MDLGLNGSFLFQHHKQPRLIIGSGNVVVGTMRIHSSELKNPLFAILKLLKD